jgi:hypothetical protein
MNATLTIQITSDDYLKLENEAKRLKLPTDRLASELLHKQLKHSAKSEALLALANLREIGRRMPKVNALELAQISRDELVSRGL